MSDARNGLAEHVVSPTSELSQGEENARICRLLQQYQKKETLPKVISTYQVLCI